jgi:hypothetical protein
MTDVAPQRLVTPARSRSAVAFVRESDMLGPVAAIADRLAAGLPGHRSALSHVLFEIPAAAGIPDMLRVAFDPNELRRRTAMDLPPVLDHTSLRVLTALAVGPAALQDIARRAAVTSAHLRRTVLPRLVEGGWLEPPSGRGDQALVMARVRHRSLVRSVVTVEAKRRDWRAAISQARRHQACADRAYIAIDAATPGRLLDIADDLARAGIGLITVEAVTSRAVQVTRPAAGFPRDDERRLIGERSWSLVLSGRSTWDTFEVFGRDLGV